MRLGFFALVVAVVALALGGSAAAATDRARVTWDAQTDIDLHVWDAAGNHAYFANPGAIPNARLSEDVIPGFGPETFVDDASPSQRTFTYGVCFFDGRTATNVTVTLTDPSGAQRTRTVRLERPDQGVVIGSSPPGAGFVPPSGWCGSESTLPDEGTPDQPLLDAGLPALPDTNPQARTEALSVSVSQNGTVTARRAGRSAAVTGRSGQVGVRCGVGGYVCFERVPTGERVVLTARAAPGYTFKSWGQGGCSGARSTCTVEMSRDRSISATFVAKRGVAAVGASLARPRLTAGWQASVGSGQLVVRGRVTRAARLQVELRRPGGAPLLVRRFRSGGGQFRFVASLRPGQLAGGALLLPGGFVVVLRGTSGSLKVPLQVKTLELAAPPEGVVRRQYASATENGPPATTLPAGAREAWAHFVFEAQPRANLEPTVSWFNPAGQLVGTVEKPNRPDVLSFARASPGLASGLWRVELRAGDKLVKALAVRIGPA